MASANLYKKIVEIAQHEFRAEQDYDFPPISIYSLPLIGFDETGFVDKELVCKQLISGLRNLEKSGADFIIIACNTVHYFQEQMQKSVKIPIVSIIDEAILQVKKSKLKTVGLLTSESTRELKIYEQKFDKENIKSISVSSIEQKKINDIILDVMGGNDSIKDKKTLLSLANNLKAKGAQGIVVGCTELPLIINGSDLKVKTFDTLEIIARAALKVAYNKK